MIEYKDLDDVKAVVYTSFSAVGYKLRDTKTDEETKNALYREFYRLYRAQEEIVTLARQYKYTRDTLGKYIAGAQWDEYEGTDMESENVYACLIPNFEPNGTSYLTDMSPELAKIFEISGDFHKRMREAMRTIFPDMQAHMAVKNELGDNELVPMTPEMTFKNDVEEQLRGIEIAEGVPHFIARMETVRDLLKAKADPIEILKLLK